MNEWVAVWRALSVMDAVRRRWAKELGLDGAEMGAVMVLAAGVPMGPAELAWASGRSRQHAFRTLRSLRDRGLVAPARCANDGSVQTWALTRAGLAIAARFEARARAWRRLLSETVELPTLVAMLQRVTRMLVNRPSTRGWGAGLAEPRECWSEFDFGVGTHALLEEVAGVQGGAAVPSPELALESEASWSKPVQLESGEGERGLEPVIKRDALERFARWCDSDDPMAVFWRRLNR